MSSRRLREKKIREEAIAHDRAVRRLKGQMETKIDTLERNLPGIPREVAEKVAAMLIATENKGADTLQPLKDLVDPSPDRPLYITSPKKKKTMTPEEFEEWFIQKMARFG